MMYLVWTCWFLAVDDVPERKPAVDSLGSELYRRLTSAQPTDSLDKIGYDFAASDLKVGKILTLHSTVKP